MSRALQVIHERRAQLVQRAATERDELAAEFEPWTRPLAVVDRTVIFVSSLRKRAPLLGPGIGLGLAVLAIVRPRGLAGWTQNVLSALRAVDSVGGVLMRVRRRPGARNVIGP